MKKYAVIVAGGSGVRMGTNVPKQFLDLRGKPVLWYTIEAFLQAFNDISVILVVPATHMEKGLLIARSSSDNNRVLVTEGGETRFHSVKNGLDHVQEKSVVFVHDGVRCLLTTSLIQRCFEKTIENGNAIPAIAAVDTIRLETIEGNTQIDRQKVKIIQTPQTFYSDSIKAAFEQDFDESFTDEASVVEKYGMKIHLIEGEPANIKITRPMDILLAERILEERGGGVSSEW